MAFRFVEPRTRVGDGINNFSGAKLFFFEFGTLIAKTTFADFALSVSNTDPVIADSNGLFGDIFTDIQGTVTLKTSADVVIYGPINFFAPEDGISALDASSVAVLDTAGDFEAENVEAALTELSDNFLRLDRTNTISAIQTHTESVFMQDQVLRRPVLKDYGLSANAVSSVSGTTTLDLTTGNVFASILTEDTTIAITNPPASSTYGELLIRFNQDSAGGAYTVTWPSSVIWPSGTAPTITTSNNAIDEITLHTTNGGVGWLGGFSQAFA